jgi:hypothetical protein
MALALFPSQNQDLYSGSTLYFAERDTVAHELGPLKKLLRCQSMNLPSRSRSQPIHLTDLPINVLSGYPAVLAHTMFPQIPRPPLVPAVMQIGPHLAISIAMSESQLPQNTCFQQLHLRRIYRGAKVRSAVTGGLVTGPKPTARMVENCLHLQYGRIFYAAVKQAV